MAKQSKFVIEPLRELAFGSLTANYQNLGAVTTAKAVKVIVTNSCDEKVYISVDGTNNHMGMPGPSSRVIDGSVDSYYSMGKFFEKGTQFEVKHAGTAPTEGDVMIEVYT